MKKSVFKRCTASIVAVTMFMSSLNFGWGIASDATEENQSKPTGLSTAVTLEITDGQLVAKQYDEQLSDEEKAILESEYVFGNTHKITKPTEDDELVAVDSDNRIVYAKNYTSGDYTWVAEEVELVVDNATVENLELEQGNCSYEGVAYDSSASFEYSGDGYSASVVYNVYVNVDTATQDKLLNIPYDLSSVIGYMNASDGVEASLELIVTQLIPELVKYTNSEYKDNVFNLNFTDSVLNQAVLDLYAEYTTYGTAKLNALIQGNVADGVAGYSAQSNKVAHVIEYADVYADVIKTTYNNLAIIKDSEAVDSIQNVLDMMEHEHAAVFALAMETTASVAEALQAAGENEWPSLDSSLLMAELTNADYTALYNLLVAAEDNSSAHTAGTVTDILADTVEISCNVNRYNVAVTFEIYVIDSSNKEELMASQNITINLASGTTDAGVVEVIDATGSEKAIVELVNSYANGIYDVNETNYVRTVTETLTGTLEADATYKVVYKPAMFTVDYTDEALTDLTVPYGTTITLPETDEEGKSYEYTIEGVKYDESEEYRVTKDVTVSRSLQKEKTGLRVLDLVAQYYSEYEELFSSDITDILNNAAVESDSIFIRLPGNELVVLDDVTKVVASSYDAGDDMVWVPVVAYVKNGSEVVQTITAFAADGSASITVEDFTTVEVEYRLEVEVDSDELLDILNLPYDLYTDAKSQLADMNSLLSYEADLDKVTAGVLEVLIANFEPDAQAAIKNLTEYTPVFENVNGTLFLSQYIKEYKALTTDVERLTYYYSNNKYADIKHQIEILADNVSIIVADPNLTNTDSTLYKAIVQMGYESYIEQLESIAEDLTKLKTKFAAMNEAIDVDSAAFESLLEAILSAKSVKEITVENGLYIVETISVDAPSRSTVKITVQVADSDGNISSVNMGSYSDSFIKEEGMTAEDLEVFAEKLAEIEASLNINKTYYECTVEGKLPEAGAEISESVTVVYTWAPKEYTVTVDGEENIITYDNRRITLPGTGDNNFKYIYTIGSKEVEVSVSNVTVTLTVAEFEALFASADEVVIEKEIVDLATERTENLISSVNSALVSAGYADIISLIPFEDADGNISIVLRVNPINGSIDAAISEVAMILANQTYVNIGGNDLINEGIYIDAAVQLVLNSGLGTSSFIELIDANGEIDENVVGLVEGQTVITDWAQGVPATGELGGLLIETTLSIVEGEEGMPLYISLEDFNDDADTLKQARKALVEVEKYVTVICEDGAVKVDVTAPEKAHELYLAAMLLQGEITLADFEIPTLVEMVEYAEELTGESVIFNEDVTAETLINTAEQLGVDLSELEEYIDTMNKVINYGRKLFDDDLANAEITATNEDGQAADLYKFLATCPTAKLVGVAGMPEAIGDLIIGDIEVPVEVTLENCNTEYTAAVVDLSATPVYNKVDLKTVADITTVNEDTVVVLLNDVDNLTVNGTTYVDLNGFTIGQLNANASVLVFDSRLDNTEAGSITTINGTDNVTITAGNYTDDVSAMLPVGYVQEDGVVSNRFYTLTTDEDGNITVAIKADFLKIEGGEEYKKIAMEIAVDVLLNAFTWGSLEIGGNAIYDIEVEDLVATYKAGLKLLASDLVEMIDCDGIEAFANDVIASLTDFAAIASAIEGDSAIAEYDIVSCPWKVELEHVTDGDYIAVNVVTGDETTRTLTFVVEGEDEDKQALVDLCNELSEVVKTLEITVNLDDLSYNPNAGFSYIADADVVAEIDLSQKEYVAVIGIIMANGMDDSSAMVEAINTYLETGKTTDIIAALEELTTSDIISSLKAANDNGITFADMISNLGIEDTENAAADLEAIYTDVLSLCYKLVDRLGLTGGNQTLADYNTGEFGTYNLTKENWHKLNLDITVILAEEVTIEPPVFVDITMEDNDTVFAMSYDDEFIYVDLDRTGVAQDSFYEYVQFNFENADEITYEYKFDGTANDFIQTGEQITVTATNAAGSCEVTYTVIVLGDVSQDGRVTSADAALIHRIVVGLHTPSDVVALAAEFNANVGITSADAALVHRKVVDLNYLTWLD